MTRRFKPPIYAKTHRGTTTWTLNIGDDERLVVAEMLGELRMLLTVADGDDLANTAALQRLFPTAYPDDEEKEAEYQRLMRDDLVTSRLMQIDLVTEALEGESSSLDEADVIALMQSVNAVRIVLGTVLDVGEDDEVGSGGEDLEAERHLYAFLSWLLDWIVRSLRN